MRLGVLTKEQCEEVRLWRNASMETLRTPYPLTAESQEAFYCEIVCDRCSPHRYWGIFGTHGDSDGNKNVCGMFLGMGGLTNISWENRLAEISLILDPAVRGKGLGEQAVDLILAEGFHRMGLKTIIAECYESNQGGTSFWTTIGDKYGAYRTTLPNRKFWNGRFGNSLYISIDGDDWRKNHGTVV